MNKRSTSYIFSYILLTLAITTSCLEEKVIEKNLNLTTKDLVLSNFHLIQDNLYSDNLGNLYLKAINNEDLENGNIKDTWIKTVYCDTCWTASENGWEDITELKDFVDTNTFKFIYSDKEQGFNVYRDTNFQYLHKIMADGGTISITPEFTDITFTKTIKWDELDSVSQKKVEVYLMKFSSQLLSLSKEEFSSKIFPFGKQWSNIMFIKVDDQYYNKQNLIDKFQDIFTPTIKRRFATIDYKRIELTVKESTNDLLDIIISIDSEPEENEFDSIRCFKFIVNEDDYHMPVSKKGFLKLQQIYTNINHLSN